MAPPVIDACFEYAVEWYFDDVLPRFLTAHYAGGGYGLIAEMMAAHDAGVGAIEAAVADIEPTPRSRSLAHRVRSQCPPELTTGGLSMGVLGLFSKHATAISGEMFQSYREIDASWRVYIYADAFIATVPYDQQKDQVLLTIFHEYIHYFESFLLRSEQPLRSREEGHYGIGERAMTRDEAHARDRGIRRRRRIWRGLALLVVLGIAAAVILGRYDFETASDRAHWTARIAEYTPYVRDLEATQARAAEVRAAWQAATAGAPDYTAARLQALSRRACPQAEVKVLAETVLVDQKGSALDCLVAIRVAAPRSRLIGVTRSRLGVRVHLRPAGEAQRVRAPFDRIPPQPDLPTEEGDALRARLRGLIERARRLRPAVDALREMEAQTEVAKRPPDRDPLPVLMAVPGDWRLERSKGVLTLILESEAGVAWAEARRPQGDRAQVISGWVLAEVGRRRDFSGRSQRIARLVPIEMIESKDETD